MHELAISEAIVSEVYDRVEVGSVVRVVLELGRLRGRSGRGSLLLGGDLRHRGGPDLERDADRIRAAGARALQINTGTGWHLDAAMVAEGLRRLAPEPRSLLFIENVGNLVCPALFDLGERARVLVA